jgi:hypothetical protein
MIVDVLKVLSIWIFMAVLFIIGRNETSLNVLPWGKGKIICCEDGL